MKPIELLRRIPAKLVFLTLSIMICVHLVMLTFYTQQNRTAAHLAKRNGVIQQIMNVIHMTEATPPAQLANAVKALSEPNLSVELGSQPKYELKANVLTFWRINKLVPIQANTIDISLNLPDGRWLNIEAIINQPAFWEQFFLLLLELLVVVIVFFYAWSINRFTKPLKDFQHAAKTLGVNISGDTKLEEFRGPQIVRETAQAMNTMQKRIKDLLHDRTLLLAAISHDLRTPITRLKLRANKIDDPELYRKTILDLDEMENMIAEILTFARNDHGSEIKSKLDLNSFLEAICNDLADVGYPVFYAGIRYRLPFYARPLTLKRAIVNLIQNAIKYGNEARVHLSDQRNAIVITIEDKGPGIPENEQEKVFSPFYRCDHSRSRAIAGTGLGMATARDAIRAHGGEVTLKNRTEGGLRVTITLRRNKHDDK